MSLISYNGLIKLIEQGIIDAPFKNVNGASIDITLDEGFMIESKTNTNPVKLKNKETPCMVHVEGKSLVLPPKEFCLASSAETFNLPNNIAAEYKLKSSLARSGLQHMLAGWCDPGWYGSKLTLEFYNTLNFTELEIEAGMKIGQIVFYECEPVPDDNSYAAKGQYNNQSGVTGSKGVR